MGFAGDLFGTIWETLKKIWDKIKKIFVKILNFFNHIVSWFKNASRVKKLKEERDVVAVAIKEKLDNGDYNVVNCLFDKEKDEIVVDNGETQAEVITTESLDNETLKNFGDKDMIVLQ